jgi:hypothetical protein
MIITAPRDASGYSGPAIATAWLRMGYINTGPLSLPDLGGSLSGDRKQQRASSLVSGESEA